LSNIEIYFDPNLHKYTDNLLNAYTSVTTVIGKYETHFSDNEWNIAQACSKIGKNPNHPKYNRYKGKSAKQIISGWKKESKRACDKGNETHNYLENSVKVSSKYKEHTSGGRLFTVKELLDNRKINTGILDLKRFKEFKIDIKFPSIYDTIEKFINDGWTIYSELCTYSYDLLVSGLIDIFLLKGNMFVILDWKTNKAPIKFEAGYYDKDDDGNITNYIIKDTTFNFPLHNMPDSVGNKYTLQLSSYANLTEGFGLECVGIILCHIRPDVYTNDHPDTVRNPTFIGKQIVDIYNIPYIKEDVDKMYAHFSNTKQDNVSQLNLFIR
jgi:hypothetical protein